MYKQLLCCFVICIGAVPLPHARLVDISKLGEVAETLLHLVTILLILLLLLLHLLLAPHPLHS